jgi:hypothetical protein
MKQSDLLNGNYALGWCNVNEQEQWKKKKAANRME